jgi:hypothetical protein
MREYLNALPESRAELHKQIDTHWFQVLLVGSTLLMSVMTLLMFLSDPFYVNKDSALFQHAGWWILNGGDLYVDIWDLKPPLIYFLTTILAALSFGNMTVLHILSVLVAVGSIVGGVTLLGVITHRLTGDGFASVTAGLSMFVLSSTYGFPYAGIRPKYLVFLCAAGALLLALDERPFLAGAVGAMAPGFWQLGAPAALLVVGICFQRGGRSGLGRAVGGGVTVTLLTIAPFVLQGHTIPMFVEVVLAPIYGVEGYTVIGRLLRFVIEIGYGVAVVPLAAYGWWLAVAEDYRKYWWVAAGGLVYSFQIFLEFQGAIELVLLFAFVALGVGLLVAHDATPSRQTLLGGVVVLLIVTSGFWQLGANVSASPDPPLRNAVEAEYDQHDVPEYDSLPEEPDWPSMQEIYWEKSKPEYCHYRLGLKQQYFEQQTGGTLYKTTCGQWPFDQPPVQWLVDVAIPFTTTPSSR